jgi:type IV pilus assembly protein PilW
MSTQLQNARRRPLGGRTSDGFGLIELMVSIVIALVIIAALVALFLGTSRNNREMATTSSMIENGRFAIQILESDVVHAGFWGTYVPQFDDVTIDGVPVDAPTGVPDPCLAYSGANWNAAYITNLLGTPLQAYDKEQVEDGAVCLGVLDSNGDTVPDMLDASDLLVARHAQTCLPGVDGCEADANGQVYLQGSLCNDDTADYVLGQTQAGTAPFNLRRIDCVNTNLAEKRKFISNLYFVRTVNNVPTLMRSTFTLAGGTPAHQQPVALVEGIDGFRVEFGVDDLSGTGGDVDYTVATDWVDEDHKEMPTNRGDGIPDGNFVRCDTATPCGPDELANVTAVRIYVLARSREPTQGYTDTKTYSLGAGTTLGPYSDGFKRHVYTTTVRLPNISGRRERP